MESPIGSSGSNTIFECAPQAPDDVVDLLFATGSTQRPHWMQASRCTHRWMRYVLGRLMPCAETELADRELLRPAIELGIERVGRPGTSDGSNSHHLLAGHRGLSVVTSIPSVG
jgi:hypothetical protein